MYLCIYVLSQMAEENPSQITENKYGCFGKILLMSVQYQNSKSNQSSFKTEGMC